MKAQQAQPQTQPERQDGKKMDIDVKINSISMEGNILATASVNLNRCLAIRNVRLMNGEKGVFLSMPSYRTGNGEFKDICFPITADFRTQLTEALVSAYKEALTMQQGKMVQVAESPAPQTAPVGPSM
ncbi:MAG: SpoVG family protein [Clostridia bacterium]|nr:SpoVG family protein [Clostridia bacterium]